MLIPDDILWIGMSVLALVSATQQTSSCDVCSGESHRDHRRDGCRKVNGG
jgi:hypothetical protein